MDKESSRRFSFFEKKSKSAQNAVPTPLPIPPEPQSRPSSPSSPSTTVVKSEAGLSPSNSEYRPPAGISFSHAKSTFSVIASIGAGPLGIPGLQAVGQIAREIVDIAETARTNKDDCKDIAAQCLRLADAVSVEARNPGAEAESLLVKHIETFVKDLQEIRNIVRILAGRKWLGSFFYAGDDASQIKRCRERVTRCTDLFQVKLQLQGHLDRQQIKVAIERLEANQSLVTKSNTSIPNKLDRGPLLPPPPPPAHFFGRDDILRKAVKAILPKKGVNISIFGPGGMGKTSLSLAILDNAAVINCFNDNRFFLRCEAITNAISLVDKILQCMGYRESVPDKDDDRMMRLYNCFGARGPVILVLDNFETTWVASGKDPEVLNIVERIMHSKTVTLIVTMRGNPFSDLAWYPLFSTADGLPPLNAESARQVYLAITPVPDEQIPLLDEFLMELGYVPLAINLTAHVGRSQSPSILLKRWKKEKTGFLQKHRGTDRLSSIDVSIELSLKVFQIKDELLRFFAFLACLTDGVYDWENNLENMAPDFPNVYASIQILQSGSLIHIHDSGQLQILSPVRLYIKDHYGELCKQDMINLENYYLKSIEEVTEDGIPEKVKFLIQDSKNIMEVFEAALRDHPSQPLVQMSYRYSKFLYSNYQYNVEFAEQFVEACQSLMLEHLLPHVIVHAGDVHLKVYLYVKAIKHYTKAVSLFKAQADEVNTAQCFKLLAFLSQRTYDYPASTKFYNAAYEIFAKLNDESGMGQCLKGLGNVLEMMEDYAGALQKLKAAYNIFDKERYDPGKVQCIQNEGEVHCKLRDYPASKERLEAAYKLYVLLDDQLGMAQCLQSLGNVLSLMGDHAGAMQKLESAYQSFDAINEQLGQAQCLQTQGYVLRISGDYTASIEKLDAALKAFEKTGSQEGMAQCLENMGHMLRANGKYGDARKRTDEAYRLYSKFGNKAGKAECLLNLAYVHMAMADLETSAQLLTEGKALFEQLEDEQGAAKCIRSLGDVCTGQKEYHKAVDYCEASFNTCKKLQYRLGMALALRSWGKALLELGQLTLAWEKLETAHTMFDTLDDKLGKAHTDAHMANLLLRQNKRKEAKERLDAAVDVYKSMSCEYGLRDCQALLVELGTA
ncbi:TPR-like protein [Imleria badia]|nr:TPR-like protein [Imleria badia]